jgi:hydroxyacylglutathione hydrolase
MRTGIPQGGFHVPRLHIETFVLGDFMTNCFVVAHAEDDAPPHDTDCWIVDCGFGPERLLQYIRGHSLTPTALLLTHAHADHIAGVDQALSEFGDMPLHLHDAERGFCSDPMKNLAAMMCLNTVCREPDHWLTDGDVLTLGAHDFRVVHAPGHSPGCVLFVNDESQQALVGDTLFAGSIGRIDFPTSDPQAMRTTIRETMMRLPDAMTIHPGHGPATTIGDERTSNPFVLHGF